MVQRNPSLANLKTNYLFPEINLRKQQFLQKNPEAKLISLGVGDTTQPIPEYVSRAMANEADSLGTEEGYNGYGPEQGSKALREKIAHRIYDQQIDPDDIFISDGAKCDIGRLQLLFGNQCSILLQDPTYPVYLDGSLLQGVSDISLAPCIPENDFFPQITQRTDLIYFCSPNNPTGVAATRAQLKQLVLWAKKNHSIILFDSAYAHFITDPDLPRSIYEIEGAKEVAIEINSFSKIAGFTGVRLGWTVVPKELTYSNGGSIRNDWKRVISTIFNGASNIAQKGGGAVLEDEGWQEVKNLCQYYMENTQILRDCLMKMNFQVFGGVNAPYVWTRFPHQTSWESFQLLLEKAHIISTPGIGFGQQGENFLRFSAFSKRENIFEATKRLSSVLA